jgi:serine/threonine-protein kinase
MVMGTPDYMAPEQARGDKVDARADIYAVGAILYRALTGKKPFEGLDPMAILTAVLVQEPERPTTLNTTLPLALELVVQRTMAKAPEDRYQSMAELDRELAGFDPDLAQRPSTVPFQPSPAEPAPDGAVKTVVKRLAPKALQAALERTQHSVQVARPGLLLFTSLGFLWLLASAAVVIGSIIRLTRDNAADLSQVEAILSLVGVTAALVTPLVLWLRYLLRVVWPSTPRSLDTMARLRATVLYGAAAYGIATLCMHLFLVLLERHASLVARPLWTLFALLFGLSTSTATWLLMSRRR